mmetsp:Transcript_2959/g.9802  ORF Transcript_2959/g.9802 Transcript_2959/m.9802 type:complete len:290 (-) Transcript_2959:1436-2305(-)
MSSANDVNSLIINRFKVTHFNVHILDYRYHDLILRVHHRRRSRRGNFSLRTVRQVVILTLGILCQLLGGTRRKELVLSVNDKNRHPSAADFGSHIRDFLVEFFLRRLLRIRTPIFRVTVRFLDRHVRATIGEANNHHTTNIAGGHGVQADASGDAQTVRERRATTARHLIETASSHRDRTGRRQKHFSLVTTERNDGNHITALIRAFQNAQRRTLGGVHSVQSHRTRGIDKENNQGTSLTGELFRAHITFFDVNLLLFRIGVALATRLLIRRGGAQRRVNSQTNGITLR